jgi:hypothetical protein
VPSREEFEDFRQEGRAASRSSRRRVWSDRWDFCGVFDYRRGLSDAALPRCEPARAVAITEGGWTQITDADRCVSHELCWSRSLAIARPRGLNSRCRAGEAVLEGVDAAHESRAIR